MYWHIAQKSDSNFGYSAGSPYPKMCLTHPRPLCYTCFIKRREREVFIMFKVYDSQDLLLFTTDDEQEAEFFAWLNDGYYC